MNGGADRFFPSYSVSYKARWWHRRRFACGFVVMSEAVSTYEYLKRQGRRPRLHISRGSRD